MEITNENTLLINSQELSIKNPIADDLHWFNEKGGEGCNKVGSKIIILK